VSTVRRVFWVIRHASSGRFFDARSASWVVGIEEVEHYATSDRAQVEAEEHGLNEVHCSEVVQMQEVIELPDDLGQDKGAAA